jgi:hypothetical protein
LEEKTMKTKTKLAAGLSLAFGAGAFAATWIFLIPSDWPSDRDTEYAMATAAFKLSNAATYKYRPDDLIDFVYKDGTTAEIKLPLATASCNRNLFGTITGCVWKTVDPLGLDHTPPKITHEPHSSYGDTFYVATSFGSTSPAGLAALMAAGQKTYTICASVGDGEFYCAGGRPVGDGPAPPPPPPPAPAPAPGGGGGGDGTLPPNPDDPPVDHNES